MADNAKKKRLLDHAKKTRGNTIIQANFSDEPHPDSTEWYNNTMNSMRKKERQEVVAANLTYSNEESSRNTRGSYDPRIARGATIESIYEGTGEGAYINKNREEILHQYRIDASNGLYGDAKKEIALKIAQLEKSPRTSTTSLLKQLYTTESDTRQSSSRRNLALSIVALIGGGLFLSSNITGNVIGLSSNSLNIFGFILMVIGLISCFSWIKSKKRY